ncbi:hypothetical protein LTS17_010293 [Exophiala oligosperma]
MAPPQQNECLQCDDDPGHPEPAPPAQTIAGIVSALRRRLNRAFSLLSSLCLSTRRADWFPATLGASLATCAAIIFVDAMMAVPSPVRELVWGNSHSKRLWMRECSYGMLVDLLRASTRGINPMKLQFSADNGGTAKSEDMSGVGVLLGDIDSAELDGIQKLKDWKSQHQGAMNQAGEMFNLYLYQQARVRTIGSLCLIYEW